MELDAILNENNSNASDSTSQKSLNRDAEINVTHLHKSSRKSENSASRYRAKIIQKAFYPIDTLLQILILIYLFFYEKYKIVNQRKIEGYY